MSELLGKKIFTILRRNFGYLNLWSYYFSGESEEAHIIQGSCTMEECGGEEEQVCSTCDSGEVFLHTFL